MLKVDTKAKFFVANSAFFVWQNEKPVPKISKQHPEKKHNSTYIKIFINIIWQKENVEKFSWNVKKIKVLLVS
jgi:hypothetical protein